MIVSDRLQTSAEGECQFRSEIEPYLLFTYTCVGAESGFFHWIRDLVDELIVSMTQEAELSEEVRNLFIYHVPCVSRGGALHVRLIRRLDVRIYPLKVWKSALLPLNKRLNVSRNPLCVLDPRSAHRSRFLSQKAKTEEELQVDLVKNCLLDSSSVRLWMKSTYMVRYFISTCIQYLSVCPTRANPTTPSQVSGCVWFTLGK